MGRARWRRRLGGPLLAAITIAVLGGAALYEDNRANEPLPEAYDWQAFPMIALPEGRPFEGATSLRRWDGVWAVRGDRVHTIDPHGWAVRSPIIPGAGSVRDVGAMSDRLVAIVTGRRDDELHLLIQTPDRRAWEEHALPGPLTKASRGIRVSAEGEGLAVWTEGSAFLLADDGWHEVSAYGSIRDVLWSQGRWLLQTVEQGGCFAGTSRVVSFDPRGDDRRRDGDEGYAGTPVLDRRGRVWELHPPTHDPFAAPAWHRAGAIRSLGNDTKLWAVARGVRWDFGHYGAFESLTFDDANRPIVTTEFSRGLFRLESDGTLTWLTPGWSLGTRVTGALVSEQGSIVLTKTGRVGALAAQPWMIHWLEPPAADVTTVPDAAWRQVPHATIAIERRRPAFSYVPEWEPTLEPLPVIPESSEAGAD